MINNITQNISPVTALPGLLSEDRPAAVNQLVEEELPLLSIELESLIGELNTFASQTTLVAAEVQENANLAGDAAAITIGNANYKGDWVAGFQTTGYSMGMSVTFTDGYNYVSKINNNLISPITLQNTTEWNFVEAVNPNNYYLKTETYTKTEVDDLHEINNKTDKTTPIDTDNLLIEESGGLFKKLSWANIKATLKTYFDTLYATPAYVDGKMVLGTAVNSTSGTSIDFTRIPSWVKRITVMFNGVSTNGASPYIVQIGDIEGIENSGYDSVAGSGNSSGYISASTAGFIQDSTSTHVAATLMQGLVIIEKLNSNSFVSSGNTKVGSYAICSAGSKTLSGILDRIRITTVNGTDTFDAGQINILYEG